MLSATVRFLNMIILNGSYFTLTVLSLLETKVVKNKQTLKN